MQRAVREQLGVNTMGKAFTCLVKAGQLGAHLKCLCSSVSSMVEKQEESDVHMDSSGMCVKNCWDDRAGVRQLLGLACHSIQAF